MPEIDSTQLDRKSSLADSTSRRPQPDDWDLKVVPLLWFVGTEVAVQQMFTGWLPLYLANGIAVFAAGVVALSVLASRRGQPSLDKRMFYFLICASAGAIVFNLPGEAVPPYLSHGVFVLIVGLLLFQFRGSRWRRYGFGSWITLWLLISASVSFLLFLLSDWLSKVITR